MEAAWENYSPRQSNFHDFFYFFLAEKASIWFCFSLFKLSSEINLRKTESIRKQRNVVQRLCNEFQFEETPYKWISLRLDLRGAQPLPLWGLSWVPAPLYHQWRARGSSSALCLEEPPLLSPWTAREPREISFNKVLNCGSWNMSTSFLSAEKR